MEDWHFAGCSATFFWLAGNIADFCFVGFASFRKASHGAGSLPDLQDAFLRNEKVRKRTKGAVIILLKLTDATRNVRKNESALEVKMVFN